MINIVHNFFARNQIGNYMFIGRKRELDLLERLFKKGKSSLAICRGRRRIGKSTLIQQFAKQTDIFLEFQGLPPRSLSDSHIEKTG